MTNVEQVSVYFQLLLGKYHMTYSTIAEHLGVSRQTVSNWHRGEQYPNALLMDKLNDLVLEKQSETFSGSL